MSQPDERVKWACRRGMLELDLFLVPFFEHQYANLTDTEKQTFQQLLEESDPVLLHYLMGHAQADNSPAREMVEKIRGFRITRSQHSFF